MASPAAVKWKYASEIDKELHKLLAQDRPTYTEFDHLIHEMRIACEHTVFLDIEFADKVGAGKRLWDAHIAINSRYRKLLDRFRKGEHKKLVVERRKIEKHYVDFLKTSTIFYKGYIQRLASRFGGIPELGRIANSLDVSNAMTDEPSRVSAEVERLVKLTCHATLLRLGDLSRYRNQVRTHNRSWEPALALYQLANDLHPASGYGHNQIAVVAVADENHLDAVYHIYRALTADDPYPLAKGNLEVEFKKIAAGWEKRRNLPRQDSLSTLVWWFCLLQAKFYDGIDFQTHVELENEVLSRIVLLLKEKSFPEILEKFVLVSLAAQHYAGLRVQEEQGFMQANTSYFFSIGFNVRMMIALIQVLLPELEMHSDRDQHPSSIEQSSSHEKLSLIARRVLPAIRQYGVWLAISARVLCAEIGPDSLSLHKRDLWESYAKLLTKLAHCFPVADIRPVPYLLGEDESTVGFSPLQSTELPPECNLQINLEGMPKLRGVVDKNSCRQPNIEMESRVFDIILCGLYLQRAREIPVTLKNDKDSMPIFQNVQTGLSLSDAATVTQPRPTAPRASATVSSTSSVPYESTGIRSPAYTSLSNPQSANREIEGQNAEPANSHSPHDVMDNYMQQMVDSLTAPSSTSVLGLPNETSYGMTSGTANEIFGAIGSKNVDRLQRTPKMLPSIPGKYSSAFIPRPNELQPVSPTRPISSIQLSPLSLSTRAEQMQAAVALDETCFSGFKPGEWSRRSSLKSPISSVPVDHSQQRANIVHSFQPSSGFSNVSSLYQNNTPLPRFSAANYLYGNGNSTVYAGASAFDRETLLQSSIWANGQTLQSTGHHNQTPPGGQGG